MLEACARLRRPGGVRGRAMSGSAGAASGASKQAPKARSAELQRPLVLTTLMRRHQ